MEKTSSVNSVIDLTSRTPAPVVIAGAGIGGIVMALALKKHCGLNGEDIEVSIPHIASLRPQSPALALLSSPLTFSSACVCVTP